LKLGIEGGEIGFGPAAANLRLFAIALPGIQSEHTAQDLLALGRALLGELIGLALQEERGVGEGFIIEAQNILNALLSQAQGGLGDGTIEACLCLDAQFEGGGFIAFFGAGHHITITLIIKLKFDGCLGGVGVNQGVITGARFTKQGPGDGIQQ